MRLTLDTGDVPQDEQIILTPIWQASEIFRGFYTAERPKITRPVFWSKMMPFMRDPVCATGEFQGYGVGNIIYLPHIPTQPGDEAIAAHELTHAVQYEAGYSAVFEQGGLSSGAELINSMLLDPLVYRVLRGYGFDLDRDNGKPTTWYTFLETAKEPENRLNRIMWAMAFVLYVLISREIDPPGTFDAVTKAYGAKLPRVGKLITRLLELIDRLGYETPDQQRAVMSAILRDFHLPSTMKIMGGGLNERV